MDDCPGCKERIWTDDNNDSGEFCHSGGHCAINNAKLSPELKETLNLMLNRIEKLEETLKDRD